MVEPLSRCVGGPVGLVPLGPGGFPVAEAASGSLSFAYRFSLELDLGLNPLRQLKTEAPEQGAVTKTFW